MAQLSDDCFDADGRMMTTEEALDRLEERLSPVVEVEKAPILDCPGRVLAEDIVSGRAVPPHDNAAVDGYAVFFDDLNPDAETRLPVNGRVAAGHPLDRPARRGEAVRIFTGAPMPEGPDTVMMQEDCELDGDTVVIQPGIKRGANRREAGEDIAADETILRKGTRLRAQDIGLAASVGRELLSVYRPLKVALLSTGDEIRDVGEQLPPGCIYDANRYALAALLKSLGCEVSDLGILPDRYDVIHGALGDAAAAHDAIITSGGVSMGEEDHVRTAVEALGSIHFWRLAIRPGRPVALGQIGGVPFIGLPGNPVAVMVTFMRFARPAIQILSGAAIRAPMAFPVRAAFGYKKKENRREWLRVSLFRDDDGALSVRKFPRDGAGILTSMVAADGLVELPEALTLLEPGSMVEFLPFSEVS